MTKTINLSREMQADKYADDTVRYVRLGLEMYGTSVDPRNHTRYVRVPSERDASIVYRVTLAKVDDIAVTCSCPGFCNYGQWAGWTCKHLRAVNAALGVKGG